MRLVSLSWLVGAALVTPLLIGAVTPVTAGESVPFVIPPEKDGVQRASLVVDSYSYTPAHLVVQAGKPVELVLNSITFMTPHNFVMNDESAGLSISEDVKAGATAVVRFTPQRPGRYPFYCDKKLLFLPTHRDKGMEGVLDVRE